MPPRQQPQHTNPTSQEGWAPEDVDVQDNLVDLNPHADAPWRSTYPVMDAGPVSRASTRNSASITTPGSRTNPTSTANGARFPGSATTPIATSSRISPTTHSPGTPSPSRTARIPPAQRETRARFTLDRILGDLRPEGVPEQRGANGQAAAGGSGPAPGAGMTHIGRIVSDIENLRRAEDSSIFPFSTFNVPSLSVYPEDDDHDRDTIMPYESPDSPEEDGGHGDDGEFVVERDEGEGWWRVGRIQQSRSNPNPIPNAATNASRPDLSNLQSNGAASDDDGPALRRGGFNRHRPRERDDEYDDDVYDALLNIISDGPDAGSGSRGGNRVSHGGLPPTNISRPSPPLVVSSTGTHRVQGRPRGRSSSPTLPKKQKTSGQGRIPAYLVTTSLPRDAVLPARFPTPPSKCHLSLSSSPSSSSATSSTPHRPIITFTSHPPTLTHSDLDATSIPSQQAIPVSCPIYYFEIRVLSKGIEGFISVGWMEDSFSISSSAPIGGNQAGDVSQSRPGGRGPAGEKNLLRRLVGWTPGTWGWHADDGRLFAGTGTGELFSETWSEGDIVGCGIDYTHKSPKAFFTKQGRYLGHRHWPLPQRLHPAVGLRSWGESVEVNFNGPFEFDVEKYALGRKEEVWKSVDGFKMGQKDVHKELLAKRGKGKGDQVSEVASPAKMDSPLDQGERAAAAFVLDYLNFNGFGSASTFRSSLASRNWIQPSSNPPIAVEKPKPLPDLSESANVSLSDFPSPQAEIAIRYLQNTLLQPFTYPVPTGLLAQLSGDADILSKKRAMDGEEPLRSRLLIYNFIHLALSSHHSSPVSSPSSTSSTSSSSPDDPITRTLTLGQHLSSLLSSRNFALSETKNLKTAFGAVADPSGFVGDSPGGEKWKRWREDLVEDVGVYIRRKRNLPLVPKLSSALSQTHQVLQKLAEVRPSTGAGMINFSQVVKGETNVEQSVTGMKGPPG